VRDEDEIFFVEVELEKIYESTEWELFNLDTFKSKF